MTFSEQQLLEFLDERKIPFQRYEHPAVFTVAACEEHLGYIPGQGTKNLFLRDKKGTRHILLTVPETKRVDIDALSKQLETSRLSFGSKERLAHHLALEPGAVTLLSVINDAAGAVEVYIDAEFEDAEAIQCHPLVNTATIVLSWSGITAFFSAINRSFTVIEAPEASA